MALLEAIELSKTFQKHKAVDDLHITIREGEVLGLLGPNGAGKSTTISMIASLLEPSRGEILYKGKSVLKKSEIIRKELGLVPQEIALYPEFTGKENLMFFARLYKVPKKERAERIAEVLSIVGLSDRASDKVEKYSGGMKRRLNIACALLHKPKLLIMDEPTVGIDPQSRNHILEMVKQLNTKGMSILYTSHYMEEVETLCDRIAIMDHGSIIAEGKKQDLIGMVQDQDLLYVSVEQQVAGFEQAVKEIDEVLFMEREDFRYKIGLKQQAEILPELFTLAHEYGIRIQGIDIQSPRLEDVFLHLTGRSLRDE
ncbi:ABC transporter ATP-binding protein [Pontibacillus marinus]|uniref:Antibiotic ABC transporter ATP-binding protein n=1 Tax=Pontibacillus marinus BH030004 = DSM 16465 TaxID=1385511 RepID=A0A0A5GK60_9BACI|nr:ABC transporter ATP-binding protein [Pontibacillus marinus]KGX91510.1 antibiotic ABC transporter ATP-binding protein [Pontibacillus marinus BH030004 = DSM 16465]